MKIIRFPECNCVFAEDQPEYLPLPAHKDEEGIVTCCWGPGFIERLKILVFGRIYLQTMTFNKPLQPLKMTANNPLED